MSRAIVFCLGLVAACSSSAQPAAAGDPAVATVATDGTRWAPIIDSHVHLAYWPVADRLVAAGVEGVVDLASPEAALGATPSSLQVIGAGPMLTHPRGYPLDAWGEDGFGVGCGDAACVTATVDRLAAHGARVIKLALDDDGLAPELVPIAVAAAHAHHLKVAAHALSDASAALAGQAGVDVLAHTPIEPLRAETIAAWRGRAVVSTLAAFGGSDTAVANLAQLRAAGCTVLYGTDLGNARVAGPNPDEIMLMARAGMDDAAIVAAMTTVPAAFWGFQWDARTYLVLDGDPRTDARRLLTPRAVVVHGKTK